MHMLRSFGTPLLASITQLYPPTARPDGNFALNYARALVSLMALRHLPPNLRSRLNRRSTIGR
jgi:hypothetical protein